VRERIGASGTIKKTAGVAKERINASSGVEAAIGIAKQGSKTRSRILVAGSEVIKRLETSSGVPDPSGAADERPDAFAIVGAGYGTARVGTHRLRRSAKPNADEHQRDERKPPRSTAAGRTVSRISKVYCFHVFSFGEVGIV